MRPSDPGDLPARTALSSTLPTPQSEDSGSLAKPAKMLRLILILALLSLYRAYTLWDSDVQLYFDEAYYFSWSHFPAFGYYSKPPMIAWGIWGLTGLCGEAESCIRLGSLISLMLAAWIQFLTGRHLFNAEVGFFSALAFATLPFVSLYSRLATTDSLLILFWSLAFLYFTRAINTGKTLHWLLAGMAIGTGLLSKYTMLFFVFSGGLFFLLHEENLKQKWQVVLSLAIAFLIFLPNLIWNFDHQLVSFSHTAEIAQLNRELFHPEKLAEFLGGQFLVFGPLFMSTYIVLALRGHQLLPGSSYRYLLSFSGLVIFVYLVQSLMSRANLNWAIVSYVAATPIIVAYLMQHGRRLYLYLAIAINLAIGIVGYHETALAKLLNIELNYKTDIFASMKGWKEFSQKIAAVIQSQPDSRLLTDNRRVLAELIYYVRPHPFDAAIWNPEKRISDQYRLSADIKDAPNGKFLFVSETTSLAEIQRSFKSVRFIDHIEMQPYPDHRVKFGVYSVETFLGY